VNKLHSVCISSNYCVLTLNRFYPNLNFVRTLVPGYGKLLVKIALSTGGYNSLTHLFWANP